MVRALAKIQRDPGFKTRYNHWLYSWFNFPVALVNSQLGFLTVVVVVLFRRFVAFVSLS